MKLAEKLLHMMEALKWKKVVKGKYQLLPELKNGYSIFIENSGEKADGGSRFRWQVYYTHPNKLNHLGKPQENQWTGVDDDIDTMKLAKEVGVKLYAKLEERDESGK